MQHLAFLVCMLFAPGASARLGETEQQSQTRYGIPMPELTSPLDKPLLPGAKEVIYRFADYRLRVALVNDSTVRIEYIHLPSNGVVKELTEPEMKAILEAERGLFNWREEKPRNGNKNLNLFQTAVEGRKWERSDHALANLKLGRVLVLETKEADLLEKKLSKTPAGPGGAAAPGMPKF